MFKGIYRFPPRKLAAFESRKMPRSRSWVTEHIANPVQLLVSAYMVGFQKLPNYFDRGFVRLQVHTGTRYTAWCMISDAECVK